MEEFNLKLTSITSDLKDKKKIFYLGAWCLADVVDDNLSNSLIHEYHWNNRKKLVEDGAKLASNAARGPLIL